MESGAETNGRVVETGAKCQGGGGMAQKKEEGSNIAGNLRLY